MKVTVDPVSVAMKLVAYGIFAASVFDLRYLASKCNSQALSIAELSLEHLKVQLVNCNQGDQKRWMRKRLTENDVICAANNVRVPIELFKLFEEKLSDPTSGKDVHKFIDEHCKEYLNKFYSNENLDENQMEKLLPEPSICMINTVEQCKTAVEQLLSYVSTCLGPIRTQSKN